MVQPRGRAIITLGNKIRVTVQTTREKITYVTVRFVFFCLFWRQVQKNGDFGAKSEKKWCTILQKIRQKPCPLHMRAHALCGDVGQSQAREEGDRPGFESRARQAARICSWRWCPKSPEHVGPYRNSWLHCYLRMCILYRSNMPAVKALASRTPVA